MIKIALQILRIACVILITAGLFIGIAMKASSHNIPSATYYALYGYLGILTGLFVAASMLPDYRSKQEESNK